MEKFSAKILEALSNQGCVRDAFSAKTGKVNVQLQTLADISYSHLWWGEKKKRESKIQLKYNKVLLRN